MYIIVLVPKGNGSGWGDSMGLVHPVAQLCWTPLRTVLPQLAQDQALICNRPLL